jgi:Icc-related predicted phosphoesterase
MKIVIISDTHSLHGRIREDIPDGDVLIHCGDVCNSGSVNNYLDFIEWFKSLPHEYKIFIGGNHDFALMGNNFTGKSDEVKNSLDDLVLSGTGIHYLEDTGVTIQLDGEEPVNFWGTPWTPEFYNWAFMKKRGAEMAEVWSKVPDNTHVLISHGPPLTDTELDYAIYGKEHVGCEEQTKMINSHPNLKVNCFGHIHEGYGEELLPNGVRLINASLCTLDYSPINKPIVIEI